MQSLKCCDTFFFIKPLKVQKKQRVHSLLIKMHFLSLNIRFSCVAHTLYQTGGKCQQINRLNSIKCKHFIEVFSVPRRALIPFALLRDYLYFLAGTRTALSIKRKRFIEVSYSPAARTHFIRTLAWLFVFFVRHMSVRKMDLNFLPLCGKLCEAIVPEWQV